jgi:hypothetical protein
MKCDFWASLLAHTFVSLYFGRKPKVRVATIVEVEELHFWKNVLKFQTLNDSCGHRQNKTMTNM